MPAPLLELEGLLHGARVLTVDAVIDRATLDAAGRVMVPMIEVLALARVAADAEVLMVHHADGSSHALRIADLIGGDHVFLQLAATERSGATGATGAVGAARTAWSAWLRIDDVVSSVPVVSVSALSFASFVGLS
jgi:hypothetical protein